jgi:hypothetical protein
MDTYTKITFNNNDYIIMKVKHRDWELPILMDYVDGDYIQKVNKEWKSNDKGHIYCTHKMNDISQDVFLHEIIIARKYKDNNEKALKKPILHINRINLDNRRENLVYDISNKNISKNGKKKRRIINLPKNAGFSVSELPTYVWYLKPNDTHGERFIIEIDNLSWKTASSKLLSLKYKFEEAKKYLRELKAEKPELFDEYCMNGEYTKLGKELYDTYYLIVNKAGYDNNEKSQNNITDLYLKECLKGLSDDEIALLQSKSFYGNQERITRKINNIEFNLKSLPKYCFYKKATENRGDYFIIKGHPKMEKDWRTSTSKNISTNDKIKSVLLKIKELE